MRAFARAWYVAALILWSLVAPAADAGNVEFDRSSQRALFELQPILNPLTKHQLTDKVVIVSFFASWCPPCRSEFMNLNTLKAEFGDDMEIVAVNVFEAWDEFDDERLAAFPADLNQTFPVLSGNQRVKQLFGDVDRIPTVFAFGADKLRTAILDALR